MTPEERKELDRLLDAYGTAQYYYGNCSTYSYEDPKFKQRRAEECDDARSALIAFVDRLTERKTTPGKQAMDAAEEIMLYVSRRQPEIAMMNQFSLAEIIQKHMDATGSPRPENSTTPTESSCSKA